MDKNKIFFCISNYGNDLRWLISLGYDYVIYDKTHSGGPADNQESKILPASKLDYISNNKKIINSSINGYNIYDYLQFIIDNYEKLPDRIAFLKGNIVSRHISKKFFLKCLRKRGFVDFNDNSEHKNNISTISASSILLLDNKYLEINNSFYLRNKYLSTKYFYSSCHFLKFCFNIKSIPLYFNFSPGGCFMLDKEDILKYPKILYQNLITFVSYNRLPGEAHLLERLLPTIFQSDLKISKKISKKLSMNDLTELQIEVKNNSKFYKILYRKIFSFLSKLFGIVFIKLTKFSNK